ncbi:hypothetical protein GAYE_SCF38G5273 [Galdieria yellowstonensis]|uniref:Thioredoxin-like fold domain-containing protein n=1 Tax=Galdieria yellowstonensis TaxID=3028027 RepID=A0AAV9IJ69_9RHOD|nr:hypothetical protein GAYE_SCF38G5273 [Galdieria yellowstonensis]
MAFLSAFPARLQVSKAAPRYFFIKYPKRISGKVYNQRCFMVSGPPLPKKKVGFAFGNTSAPVELQVFLDYCCPYSKTAYLKLMDSILPSLNNQVLFVFQNQIQPWHPQSTLMHEASLAVGLIAKEKFFDYSRLLFEHQEEFFDSNCYEKSRKEIYEELAKLASKIQIPHEPMMNLLSITASGNSGNQVQMLMKFAIKYSRKLGVHVSPTYFVNGIEDTAAGSAWNKEEWLERLQPLL